MKSERMNCASLIRFVYGRDDGFTLLEMLLSFSIVIVICSIFPLIIQNITFFKAASTDNYDINFELCMKDILSEVADRPIAVKDGVMTVTAEGEKKYSYLFHSNRIIRRVNNSGYTILMENVKDAKFKSMNHHFYLQIEWQGHRRMNHEIVWIR